ncbi:MAG: thioesterase [Saccharothrix sp.]|nr:thioesterase [Saccharothrix sp.]
MNPWVLSAGTRAAPPLRLLCLPAAGAGASMYREWARRLPSEVEVLPVQLPGREGRLAEPPVEDYLAAVKALADGIGPLLDGPYVLFGHSMGALLAFGLAALRREDGLRQPERLIVSGMPAPNRYDRAGEHALAESDDDGLVASLVERGGTAGAALANPELLALVLPTLRADYRVCASLPEWTGEPFDFPIDVLSGADDDITADALDDWRHCTRGRTGVRTFPGGHFYLTGESEDAVLDAVAATLAGPRDEPRGVPSGR